MAEGERMALEWAEAREANRLNWDDRAGLHVHDYGLDAFREDPGHLSTVVRDDLKALQQFLPEGVAGLDVCHLQCHIGTDTISLARAGARVTGLDFSPAAIAAARALAREVAAEVTWVVSDVLDARAAVEGTFDLVYTSIGTICWLNDLDRWAAQIAGLLRPGGLFYIRDGHPMMYTLDEHSDELRVAYPYFGDGRAVAWDDPGTYVGEGQVAHPRSYEWPHPLSEIVNAVLGAGLQLERLDEGTTLPWRFSGMMEQQGDGEFVFPEAIRDRVPTTFTVIARLPGA